MLRQSFGLLFACVLTTVSADTGDVASIILDGLAGPDLITTPGLTTTFANEPFQTSGIPDLAKHDFGQVGSSPLGRLDTPYLPAWLPDANGQQYETAPWGARTAVDSDGTKPDDVPVTNVVRRYNFTIHRGLLSPDGVLKEAIMVNGQHPGPTIEANWGDYIEIEVHNEIASPSEGTAIHAHGMLQRDSAWADGVSGITQCPIAPGNSVTYRFRAELHGSSFWHAHYSSQYTAGVIGAIVVHGPPPFPYDIDVGPIMLSDLNHIPYFNMVSDVVGTNASLIPPKSDTLILNGRNSWDCAIMQSTYDDGADLIGSGIDSTITDRCTPNADLSRFRFQAGKTHRLRFINHAADIVHKITIDGLPLTIIAQDLVAVNPYNTDVATIGVAQRTDVLFTAPSDPKASYWMRSTAASGRSCGFSTVGLVTAAIYNQEADTTVYPTSVETRDLDFESCANDLSLAVPMYSITPSTPSFTQNVEISVGRNATGSAIFALNNISYYADFNSPILRHAAQGRQTTFPDHPEWNVYDYGTNSSIVFNITNPTPITHPFHMHQHNLYVLASGEGVWDGTSLSKNPTRRDTWMVPPLGFSVFQIESDIPGAIPIHCLSMTAILNADKIPAWPKQSQDLCDAWDAYSSHGVDVIDNA